ncbi:MAG: monovalent cation/H(+) antiporter subunit G [Thermoanaerobaculales bacterium]|jgi:multicomponent Na+:H+ antiporter subunit G|nr:monovalent cation/H(+) antiporter subunit G [Thermoanaerobaculales bacterium]
MSLLDLVSTVFLMASVFFFTAGTVGLIRLPDLHSRLHALTKADNVGLGFAVAAVLVQSPTWSSAFKLALVWVLILAAATNVCFLIAGGVGSARRAGNEED